MEIRDTKRQLLSKQQRSSFSTLDPSRFPGDPRKKAAREDSDVQAAVETVAARLGETGRILVRESGTEPVLRVMAEAPEDAVCRECVAQVAEVIRRKGHCVS